MKFQSTKLGVITYKKKDIVTFIEGLMGFESLRQYIWLERSESQPFSWLQSIDDPNISFVAINPFNFFGGYEMKIDNDDYANLQLKQASDAVVLTLVTVPPGQPTAISTNLLAPILINKRNSKAKQVILHHSGYLTRHPLIQ